MPKKTFAQWARRVTRSRQAAAKRLAEEEGIRAAIRRYDATPGLQDAIAGQPHPYRHREAGQTAAEWVEWLILYGDHRGRLRLAKFIEDVERGLQHEDGCDVEQLVSVSACGYAAWAAEYVAAAADKPKG